MNSKNFVGYFIYDAILDRWIIRLRPDLFGDGSSSRPPQNNAATGSTQQNRLQNENYARNRRNISLFKSGTWKINSDPEVANFQDRRNRNLRNAQKVKLERETGFEVPISHYCFRANWSQWKSIF